MSHSVPASTPLSPTFSNHSATTSLSLGTSKAFVSALLVLPPSSSPSSPAMSAYSPYARRSSISAGAANRGLFTTTLAAATPEATEDPPLTATTDGSALPETPSSPASPSPFGAPKARAFGAPADGEKKKRRSSRRPATSGVVLEDKSISSKRASVAAGSPGGIGSVAGSAGRALGYVEGVKGVFKGMGIPVSILRSTAMISSHITPTLPPTPPSPSLSLSSLPPTTDSTASAPPSNLTFVILVPLNDHPSHPPPSYTARLILESGKTPSSICFDLDSEIRGKDVEGWEEERLEGALRTLSEIETRRKEGDWKGVGVVVIAYSSNAGLSDAVKRKCLDAGAELVLHPPYDAVHPGVPVAIQGAIDAALRAQAAPGPAFASPSSDNHQPPDVVRRRPAPLSPPPTPPLKPVSVPALTSTNIARSTSAAHPPSLAAAHADAPRRASVDTGGVSLAFSRALEYVDEIASIDDLEVTPERTKDVESELELAELLMGMHLETQRAVSSSSVDEGQLLQPMSPEKRKELAGKLDTWGFEPHMLDETDLFRCAQMMFEGAMWCEGLWELDVPKNQIDSFILSVRQIYHAPNPYHNYIHATDVLQATYTFLALAGVVPPFAALGDMAGRPAQSWKRAEGGLGRAGQVLRPEDIFALVVAAIGHDAAHPGLSNVFMKNAKTPLSQIYSDSSVLENMHCLLITTLLRKHGFSFIFGPAPRSTNTPQALDWTGFRKILFSTIMATDMAMHFGWIVKLGQLGDKIAEDRCSLDENEVWEDRIMVCQALIKCSDISNPTRPHHVSEHWSTVLLEEWTQQALLESGLQLPVSVVKNADAALQAKGQVGFIDLFVQPLFNAVSEVIPQLEPFARLSSANRALWSDRLATLTAASAPSIPIKPSKYSGPPLDIASFSVPCAIDSPYRTVFPYTLPGTLIAEIVDAKLPGASMFDSADNDERAASPASTLSAVTSPRSPSSALSLARPGLTSGRPDSHKKLFKSAYLHGVYDASARRKRERTGSSSGSGSGGPTSSHRRQRSESYSSQ